MVAQKTTRFRGEEVSANEFLDLVNAFLSTGPFLGLPYVLLRIIFEKAAMLYKACWQNLFQALSSRFWTSRPVTIEMDARHEAGRCYGAVSCLRHLKKSHTEVAYIISTARPPS